MIFKIRKFVKHMYDRLTVTNCENLIWIVNIAPHIAGFGIDNKTINVPFFVIHISLLFYVYAMGCIVYVLYDAKEFTDYIQNFVSISIAIFVGNSTYWFLKKRALLRSMIKNVREIDNIMTSSESLRGSHVKLLRGVKLIILAFYTANTINGAFIYVPRRINVEKSYFSMRPCFGIEPVNELPYRHICHAILLVQEITVITITLNFQALVVLLIGHTGVMYHLLSYEMLSLADLADKDQLACKRKLRSLINNHNLLLNSVEKLKMLYSIPIGINFGTNAICMTFFFFLSLKDMITFMPVLQYCSGVFFLYCYLGQRLLNAVEIFERSVYACGWERFDVGDRKAIYKIMLLAQRPVQILAADIVPVNIATFATTMQAMYKFITVAKV